MRFYWDFPSSQLWNFPLTASNQSTLTFGFGSFLGFQIENSYAVHQVGESSHFGWPVGWSHLECSYESTNLYYMTTVYKTPVWSARTPEMEKHGSFLRAAATCGGWGTGQHWAMVGEESIGVWLRRSVTHCGPLLVSTYFMCSAPKLPLHVLQLSWSPWVSLPISLRSHYRLSRPGHPLSVFIW